MSYPCKLNQLKECDGCMECESFDILLCEVCEEEIGYEEIYYVIGNEILCQNCVIELYGRINC